MITAKPFPVHHAHFFPGCCSSTSATLLRTDALATHLFQGSTWTASCSSEMGGNVVYVSKIFDVVSPLL